MCQDSWSESYDEHFSKSWTEQKRGQESIAKCGLWRRLQIDNAETFDNEVEEQDEQEKNSKKLKK